MVEGELLKDIWYYAMPSQRLGARKLAPKIVANTPIAFGRTKMGKPFALHDICPHRGVPLSHGRVLHEGEKAVGDRINECQVECPYHGWRFGASGHCTAIPSLVPGQDVEVDRIRVKSYPVRETQGCIWVYLDSANDNVLAETAEPTVDPVALPRVTDDMTPNFIQSMTFECNVDHAVIGLMDPAHGPFVHRSWWWRSETSIHQKEKKFAPTTWGFKMVKHTPSTNSGGYKILGGTPTTEISFHLPGVRTELIEIGEKYVLGLTSVTPITEVTTEVTHVFYWTVPWLGLIKPFLGPFAHRFLKQDRDMVLRQQEGLRFNPRLMLINDADVQAKWYFRLKKEWGNAAANARPFENPVKETALHWRS